MKVKRLKRIVLSTAVAELYSFVKCFGSCQFLRGLWMDISGEVADIHMRTDAKNLVTTARTIHLLEQKETIHMDIYVATGEACSGNIHDLAHIPTQNCLSDCLTKISSKADNLITAVKTGRLLDVDIHPNFRTLMEHKAYLSTWCRTFLQKGEGCFLPECFEDFSRTNSTRRTIPCDVCENSHVFRESRCFENNVCICRLTQLFLHEDDDIGHAHVCCNHFLSVSPSFSSSVVPMSISRLTGFCITNNSYQESILEDYDCPFLDDYNCKEEEQYDSELESEDDECPGTENHSVHFR